MSAIGRRSSCPGRRAAACSGDISPAPSLVRSQASPPSEYVHSPRERPGFPLPACTFQLFANLRTTVNCHRAGGRGHLPAPPEVPRPQGIAGRVASVFGGALSRPVHPREVLLI